MKKHLLLSIFSFLFVVNCNAQVIFTDTISVNTESITANKKLPLVEDGPIKNVIFIIGDGTGLAQIYSGQMHLVGKRGLLHVQTLPVTGLVKTYSADSYITDSASGATAYSCGVKTDNGMIGQLPDGRTCKTILEMAEERGLSTGLVATSTVTHATPASYAAHVPSRGMETEIAAQFLTSGTDVILGGGTELFLPEADGGRRDDGRNLVEEFKSAGFDYVTNARELDVSTSDQVLGLFSPGGMP
ncbi:MAG: alkaline phosphatase, partial [Balneolales bacterium]|nr:alkaline phosphatase [Balneolales bacterium]